MNMTCFNCRDNSKKFTKFCHKKQISEKSFNMQLKEYVKNFCNENGGKMQHIRQLFSHPLIFSRIIKKKNHAYTNTQSPGSIHPLPRIPYPISRSHYFSHYPKRCKKLSQPGDLDNLGRKLIFEMVVSRLIDWLGILKLSPDWYIDWLISWLVLAMEINRKLWIDWLIAWLGAFFFIFRLIDWCTAFAPVVTRASHVCLYNKKSEYECFQNTL